ncbi:MAG TPA: transcriptional repressor LexA [Acidimicrobiales bacterium]|nr:transcriptional repressor LexA [Acidimicrobiales bacterium]|tara:strand:+ start:4081 stop:4716 length:636 start_codon:yes stop_codon:yes gene_type:complete
MEKNLTNRQQQILDFIDSTVRDRGYPPSVREIGEAVGLTSPSTVHSHMSTLQDKGYIERDPSIPRGIKVCRDPATGFTGERGEVRYIPLVGQIAAGGPILAQENIEESLPLPAALTGNGDLFMLKVKGDSMIDAGIFDGDYVVVQSQTDANPGDLVAALINGVEYEATVKYFRQEDSEVVLTPANSSFSEMRYPATDVTIQGRVVTVLRKI